LDPKQNADPGPETPKIADQDPGTPINADPDIRTPIMPIQCGSGYETLKKCVNLHGKVGEGEPRP